MHRAAGLVIAAQIAWLVGFDASAGAAPAPTCAGRVATIVGTAGNDTIDGTTHADVIVGSGGRDIIRGHGGDDIICGSFGADQLFGGPGNDRLYGGHDGIVVDEHDSSIRYGDLLDGGAGSDILRPGKDNRPVDDISPEVISWIDSTRQLRIKVAHGTADGFGNDKFTADKDTTLVGGPRRDIMIGSTGPDELDGYRGNDMIYGRGGDDFLWADDTSAQRDSDVVNGGPGNDQLEAWSGSDALYGGDGDDYVSDFGNGTDVLYGGAGRDHITNELNGGGEQMRGGPGADALTLMTSKLNPDVAAATGTFHMATGAMSYTLGDRKLTYSVLSFEQLTLMTYGASWSITGTDGANRVSASGSTGTHFQGLGGADVFSGSAHDDVFDGGPGTDRATQMGAGDDTCISVETLDPLAQDDCEHVS